MIVESINGTCYEDAWRFLIKEEEGELIHGTVESLGRRISHAWVELPTGYIWEPQTKSYFSIKAFDVAASPLEEHRYTVEEAAIMLSRVGKHGPWTKKERGQFLKGGSPSSNNPEDKRLLKVAIEREPLRVAKQLSYEVHRLSAEDVVDKGDYAEGYRFRISKTVEGKPYPDIFMARSEKEIVNFLKREILPKPPAAESKRYTIKEEPEPLYKSGKKYVAYYEDGTPRYLAAETEQALKTRLLEAEPNAEFVTLIQGGNPMKREAQRKSFHERIFGKGSTPPLERLGSGETLNNLLPMSPEEGPPLPRGLRLKWPWKK